MKIAFFGSPAPAAFVLERLLEAGHEVAAVVTQPDKPVGRKQVMTPCAVAALARERGIPLLQPVKLRSDDFREAVAELGIEAAIVVAYGRIIPPAVLSIPRHGFLNVHFSLLPRHRGASPVAAAILAGDDESGVSIMQLDEGLDTGPVLERAHVALAGDERTPGLTSRLAGVGAELLSGLIGRLERGERAAEEPQDESRATLCRPIGKDEGRVDWSLPARLLDRRLRAFDPWPGVFTMLEGQRVKILDARVADTRAVGSLPGTVQEIGRSAIVVATGEGCWDIRRLQPEGKGPMEAGDFARGRRLVAGARFE